MGGVHRPKDGTAGEGRAERLNKYERKIIEGKCKDFTQGPHRR